MVKDDQHRKQQIAEQRHKLGDDEQTASLIPFVRSVKNPSGEGTDNRKENLYGAHKHNRIQTNLFYPAAELQVLGDIPGEKVQHKGGGGVENRAAYIYADLLPRLGGGLYRPVEDVPDDHKDIRERHS